MTDYNTLSDFEINKRVAEALCGSAYSFEKDRPSTDHVAVYRELSNAEVVCSGVFDYCNNPADAWPVIVENKINTVYDNERNVWTSYNRSGFDLSRHINPLRAAMIVFLMMKESEDE